MYDEFSKYGLKEPELVDLDGDLRVNLYTDIYTDIYTDTNVGVKLKFINQKCSYIVTPTMVTQLFLSI